MKRSLLISLFLLCFCVLNMMVSCKKEVKGNVPPIDTTQTYYSVKGFVRDQIELLFGQPYVLNKYVTTGGKTDSSMVNFYNMDLGYVLKTFLATDISNPKFLGHYNFSGFDEGSTGNHILMYEAKEPELFTRNLSITIDATNNKILSLYTETAKNERGTELRQKLLYVPLKVIQIQEDQSSTFSKTKNLRIEYRFLQ